MNTETGGLIVGLTNQSCMCQQVNYMPRIDLSSIYWHSAVYVTLCSLGERSTNWATRATQMVGVRIYNTTQHNTKANSNHCAMAQYTITLTHCNWWAINPFFFLLHSRAWCARHSISGILCVSFQPVCRGSHSSFTVIHKCTKFHCFIVEDPA